MKYIAIVLTLLPSWYLISYARYEWGNNKLPAVGAVALAIVSIVVPAVLLLLR